MRSRTVRLAFRLAYHCCTFRASSAIQQLHQIRRSHFVQPKFFPEIAFFLHPNSVGHRSDCGFLVVESLANTFMCRHKFLLCSVIWQCWMCCFNLLKPPLRLGAGLEDLRKNFSKNLQELSANPLVRRLARPPNRVFSVHPASILATIVLKSACPGTTHDEVWAKSGLQTAINRTRLSPKSSKVPSKGSSARPESLSRASLAHL